MATVGLVMAEAAETVAEVVMVVAAMEKAMLTPRTGPLDYARHCRTASLCHPIWSSNLGLLGKFLRCLASMT